MLNRMKSPQNDNYMKNFQIDNMQSRDWEMVRQIYEHGIRTGHATFESEVPSWKEWNAGHLPVPRLVARLNNEIVGWAALSPVSDRCVYGGVAEVSVYVSPSCSGKGIGSGLLNQLIEKSERTGIWTLQAGIFPENEASIVIHKRCGFKILGIREKLGKMNGIWRDVVLLERRSAIAGVD